MKEIQIKTHDDYLKLLKILEKSTKYFVVFNGIEYNDDHDDYVLDFCKKNLRLINTKKCANLLSNQQVADKYKKPQYEYEVDSNSVYKLFKFLREFETFFHRPFDCNKEIKHRVDFGLDDIAFIDSKGDAICMTITHERMLWANDKVIAEFNK